ncbi:MAG: hypothetical protein NT093_01350 [Candidatus Moranbacteria bacterium]|nr:hypothetical protein [Candidatus Moranbacteria bacterium]
MPKQINPQTVRRLKYFSRIFGGMVFLVGLSALIGWQFDLIFFKRVISSLPIIAPNTALANIFFLFGACRFFDAF